MLLFFAGMIVLIGGYFIYGKIISNLFGEDDSKTTPAYRLEDGIDYMPMPPAKVFLIQLLNIAGLGPIFGAIQGALFGPIAFVWIALGSVFAGAVHDYFSGMISLRHDGKSVSELTGIYLGGFMKQFMRFFSIVLLILVGTVFMSGPAGLLTNLGFFGIKSMNIWLAIIFVYYFLATLLPIDKIIGKIYPLFGFSLLFMALGIGIKMIMGGYSLPAFKLAGQHPEGLPVWAMLFTTIACGAISGFHATQSPMMARCMEKESQGRPVFYGAMIAEGMIAMIWAAIAMVFFGNLAGGDGIAGLYQAGTVAGGGFNPAVIVEEISSSLLGKFGAILAMIGVIAAPITSGDTAFRSARLTIADMLNNDQAKVKNRLILTAPLFVIAFILTRIDFSIIWRYFAWANQTLAMVALWVASSYLVHNKKNHWFTTIPAVFMSAVSFTYLLQASEGFGLSTKIAYPLGAVLALVVFVIFMVKVAPKKGQLTDEMK